MILSFEQRHSAGYRLTPMGGGGSVDNSGQNYAARMQADLSREQLDWAKEIYASTADERATTSDLANQLSRSQLEQSQQQTAIARQAQDDYNNTYRPLEQSMVEEAKNYDTPERRAAAAAAASADAETAIAAQRGATMREMERAGVNPASGRTIAMQSGIDLGAAKVKAGAANTAMRQVETIGAAKKADAVNLGRGIASSQATNAALAMQQGNSSVGNSTTSLNAASAGVNGMQAGFQGAQQGLASAGQMYGNIASQQQSAANADSANTSAGIGAIATIAAVAI